MCFSTPKIPPPPAPAPAPAAPSSQLMIAPSAKSKEQDNRRSRRMGRSALTIPLSADPGLRIPGA